jgi:uncharacterized protein
VSRQIAIGELEALHRDIDLDCDRLIDRLPELSCWRGCIDCCVDDLTVFTIEAELIRIHHGDLLATGTPGAVGGCAFLSTAGDCRIYEQRPYVCRSQGLPLRWREPAEGELVEYRDICPLNLKHLDPLELPPEDCWLIGPVETRLQALQKLAGGLPLERIPLRDLFENRD